MARISRPTIVLLCLLMLTGCGYGEVSPQTYKLAKAIHNVSSRQQAEKLPQVNELIASSLKEGQISEQEAEWLRTIVAHADEGDWEEAAKQSRRIMEDQVQY